MTREIGQSCHSQANVNDGIAGQGSLELRTVTDLSVSVPAVRAFDPDIWHEVTVGSIAERIRKLLRVTPLVPVPVLGRRAGADVWLKLESLQRTGSFKLRGAAARLAAMSIAGQTHAIAASAGNHGLGVALAARTFGIQATVLVSSQAPESKRAGIAALGATVEVVGTTYGEAEAEARRRAAADPTLTFVSGFDDDYVIAGNGGLLAREILAQLPDVETVIAPVGGGGLAAGLGVELVPRGIRIVGVEPEANCAMKRSLEDGRAYTTYDGGPTLAEGLEGAVSERTFAMAKDYFPEIALVSEIAIRRAIVYAYRTLGLVCEASAAVAIAALLDEAVDVHGRRVVIVISGSNIEASLLDQLLAGSAAMGV
jgi:threonine dehydratase